MQVKVKLDVNHESTKQQNSLAHWSMKISNYPCCIYRMSDIFIELHVSVCRHKFCKMRRGGY